jgi:glutamate N-acetyltransferase / amino-acid N-acetyltransferase
MPTSSVVDPSGSVVSPRGFRAGAARAGLKTNGDLDVAILVSESPCATAGLFTTSAVRAAPVLYDQELLKKRPGRIQAVAMNARVANAGTGRPGLEAAAAMARAAEEAAGLPSGTALVLSTGVIGVPLPVERVGPALVEAARAAGAESPDGVAAARAIMTTDTKPKHVAVRVEGAGSGPFTVGGIAKGAGMIHPNMATMLAVLTTDVHCDPAGLAPILKRVADRTLNAISVDGDTSTNDTVLLLANGQAGVDIGRDGTAAEAFEEALLVVARELALMIVRDGEGATKLLEIRVTGAPTESAAREVGRAIARSVLVKTAIHGGDPNWGRVLAAAGVAGVPLDPDRLSLAAQADGEADWLCLARDGAAVSPDPARARAVFEATTIRLHLDLGLGRSEATAWTCDLSPDYIKINADYTS